jgi:O-acetyl-ADP-ribose deacetylase (regulator of RNase III)
MVRSAKLNAVTAALPRIDLVARDRALYEAWTQVFEPFEEVAAHLGDLFAKDADAMLSPANSFGIMDGGLDLAIRDQLGFEVQSRAQKAIVEEHHGELPVGAALVIPTDHARWPYLIVAPTMRIPEPVPRSLNAYLAFRAAITAVVRFNERAAAPAIRSLVCPGLATGIGQMPPRRCAAQMRLAYMQVSKPARIPSFDEIHRVHRALTTTG